MENIVSKIKLKLGSIEVNYEGDPAFLGDDLVSLLETLTDLSEKIPEIEINNTNSSNQTSYHGNREFSSSTATIAAHNGAKTGPELAICAMAHLELVRGQSTNDRSAILTEMKTASAFYNDNMGSNISATLKTLSKNKRINDVGSSKYALSRGERERIEATIAAIE